MNLLNVLACGVRGAESGTVEIYRRGTSTFATVYTGYDGAGVTTPTAGLALDSNGSIVRYVNEAVDCIVKSATAATVRTFTAMVSATDVEVRSQSFTGTNYTTGASGASNPVTAEAIFDLWRLSAGTIDWKVLIGSTNTTLSDAFAAFSGIFYNVKAPAYGALGDSTTNDVSAIQAALTAAGNAGGGIVFFPQGTYRITSSLSVPSGVTLWGAGCNATIIAIDHATADAIVFAASATSPTEVRGLTVLALQANTGKHLVIELGTRITLFSCHIGSATTSGVAVSVDNASTLLTAVGTTFQNGGAASYGLFCNAVAARVILLGCRFKLPATHNGYGAYLNTTTMSLVLGCQFDASAVTTGAGSCILAAGSYAIIGNRFETPAGGPIAPITPSGTAATGKFLAGNSITQSVNWAIQSMPVVGASAAIHEGSQSQERDVRRYYITDNSASITVDPSIYGVAEVRRTNNGNQTINGGTPPSAGLMFTLTLNNDQAGVSGTITLGSDFKGQAPFTVIANNVRHLTFRSVENAAAGAGSATKYWAFAGSSGDVTP